MGAYCELLIDDVAVWSEKRSFPPSLEIVFFEEDKYEYPRGCEDIDDLDVRLDVGYKVSLRAARFRLAIKGYTISKAKMQYNNWKNVKRKPPDEYFKPENLSSEFYTKYSFEDYVALLKGYILNNDYNRIETPDENYIISTRQYGYDYGFPSEDPNYVLSVLLNSIDGEYLKVSLRDMIAEEFWSISDELDGWKDGHLIVITEGKTDNEILRDSFQLLFPDHSRAMRFFDYGFKPQAGTNNNVNLLKSFAAVGISNPVLAIFDNDTAGHEALRDAKSLRLPNNFFLASYPNIELACDYPTLGPSGLENLDVNGRACGIEMYVGKEHLLKDNTLIPIRWTGYNHSMKMYQGEISDKKYVMDSFKGKMKSCQNSSAKMSDLDWFGLRAIMEVIENAVLEN